MPPAKPPASLSTTPLDSVSATDNFNVDHGSIDRGRLALPKVPRDRYPITVLDQGKSPTHKDLILKLHLQGGNTLEIA